MKTPIILPVGLFQQKLLTETTSVLLTNVFLSFLLFVISACNREEVVPTVHQVDPALEEYFTQFKVAALQHGCASALEVNCRVTCEEIDGLYIGYADKKNHLIAINEKYLQYPAMMEFIMMHECGHYFYNMQHGDNFIMADGLSTDVVRQYMHNRSYYISQFFTTNANKTSAAGTSDFQEGFTGERGRCNCL